jgi:hypothetical protein
MDLVKTEATELSSSCILTQIRWTLVLRKKDEKEGENPVDDIDRAWHIDSNQRAHENGSWILRQSAVMPALEHLNQRILWSAPTAAGVSQAST